MFKTHDISFVIAHLSLVLTLYPSLICLIFHNIPGLTIKYFTDCLQSLKSDALHFSGLQIRQIDVRHADFVSQLI